MKYASIMTNDIVDCDDGICVSFWTQGCPHKCLNCHNPETWDCDGGEEASRDSIVNYILDTISANGIKRNFSILGGEPLCENNISDVRYIIRKVRSKYPKIKIFLWTGYTWEELMKMNLHEFGHVLAILQDIDILVDGRYIDSKRDITLKMRGSNNQRIIDVQKSLISNNIVTLYGS